MEAISAATYELRSRKQKSDEEKVALLAQKEGYIAAVEELKQSIAAREKDGETFAAQIEEYDQKIKAVLEKRQQIEGETTKFRAEEREVSAKKGSCGRRTCPTGGTKALGPEGLRYHYRKALGGLRADPQRGFRHRGGNRRPKRCPKGTKFHQEQNQGVGNGEPLRH